MENKTYAAANGDAVSRVAMMRAHIDACRAGSLTVVAYCKEQGRTPSNYYYYWQKRVGPAKPACSRSSPAFMQITPTSVHAPTVSITYPNGVQLSFAGDVNTAIIKALVCCI